MSKRFFTLVSIVILASMILGACATATTQAPAASEAPAVTQAPAASEAPAVTQAPAASEAPAATQPSTGAFQCTDKIGCVTVAPTDPIHIAYLLVVSGPNAALGTDARNGVEIAIDDAGGKILGHTIKFDGQDGGCSPEGGQTAGTALAADPTIVGVIGTSCSSEARAALPLLSKAGFITISPSNTAPSLTTPGSPDNYVPAYARTAHNDNFQGTAAAEYAYTVLKLTKVATIHDGSLYADELTKVFAAKFKDLGGTVTTMTSVDPNATDMSSVLADIATGSPQLIYFPIFMPAGALIIKQAKTTPGLEHAFLMGADGLFSPDVASGAGSDIEGFLVSSPAVSGAPYQDFLTKYKAKFGTGPINIFHAHAYDAFNILKAAIEKVAVQDADGTLHIPRSALQEAVINTVGFKGLTGTLTCNETLTVAGTTIKFPGDCSATGMAVWEYHNIPFEIFKSPEVVWIQGTGVIKEVTPP
jgi:branched-chain amino acid transport system substrate-binding protein